MAVSYLYVKESWSDGTAYKGKQVRKKIHLHAHIEQWEKSSKAFIKKGPGFLSMHLYQIPKIIQSLGVERLLPLTNELMNCHAKHNLWLTDPPLQYSIWCRLNASTSSWRRMWKLNKQAKFSIKGYMLLLLFAGSFAELILQKHLRLNI